jgi:hypothetical protein
MPGSSCRRRWNGFTYVSADHDDLRQDWLATGLLTSKPEADGTQAAPAFAERCWSRLRFWEEGVAVDEMQRLFIGMALAGALGFALSSSWMLLLSSH